MPARDPQTGELWTHPEFGDVIIYIDGDNVRTIRPSGTAVQFPLRGWVESRVHRFLSGEPLSPSNPHANIYAITTARQHFDIMLYNYRNERQEGNRRDLSIAHLYYLLLANPEHELFAHPQVVQRIRDLAGQYATWPMLESRVINNHIAGGSRELVHLEGPSRLDRVGVGWPFSESTEDHGTIHGILRYTETPEELAPTSSLEAYRDEQQNQAIMDAVFDACAKGDWRLILPSLAEPYRSVVRNYYEEQQPVLESEKPSPTLWDRLEQDDAVP
jgi:hypothetical protein